MEPNQKLRNFTSKNSPTTHIDRSQNTRENPWNARAHQHSMAAKHLASKLAYLIFFDFTFPLAIAAKKQV